MLLLKNGCIVEIKEHKFLLFRFGWLNSRDFFEIRTQFHYGPSTFALKRVCNWIPWKFTKPYQWISTFHLVSLIALSLASTYDDFWHPKVNVSRTFTKLISIFVVLLFFFLILSRLGI